MNRRSWISSLVLLLAVLGVGSLLAAWKHQNNAESAEALQNQPEPVESVTVAVAEAREHRQTSTSIGTVLALRSITLRNELPGTVKEVSLEPGAIVEPGQVLVALDVSVEEAELAALQASANLASTNLRRAQRLVDNQAVPVAEVERALAERDVALAQIERVKATIARKTLRAPFRARVGMADVHPGQFLEAGTLLTSLQGMDSATHVDFEVAQDIAAGLKPGAMVELIVRSEGQPIPARVVALDSRVNSTTRNTTLRARVENSPVVLMPGASVRVRVAHGPAQKAVVVPASALRRGPAGDHLFVVDADDKGNSRVHVRKVKAGPSTGTEVLVFSGLEPGERVAASGSFKLRDAALVAIVEQQAVAASGGRNATSQEIQDKSADLPHALLY